ncbi:MAG: hypothetical protein AAF749_07455 [Pseudomonadota bacterium]
MADESNGLDLSASAQLDTIEEVRVIANKVGSDVNLYIEPDFVLGPEIIRGLAVNDLEELLNELEPELEGGRAQSNGRRVILVNGRRIADFREIRSYPPEVIAQVEIYPEEAAAQYGFRANQKVVNFILKARFQAYTSRLASTGYGEEESGEGGEVSQADLGYLRVQGSDRASIDLNYDAQSPLHDSDREVPARSRNRPGSLAGNVFSTSGELSPELSAIVGVPVQAATLPSDTSDLSLASLVNTANAPEVTDVRPFRTLLADLSESTFAGAYSKLFADRVTATLSADFEEQDRITSQGLGEVSYRVPADHPSSPFSTDALFVRVLPIPLERTQEQVSYRFNASFLTAWRGLDLSWLSSYLIEDREASTLRGLAVGDFIDQVNSLDPAIDPFNPGSAVVPQVQLDSARSSTWSSELLARGVLSDLASGPVQFSARAQLRGEERSATTLFDASENFSRVERNVTELRLNVDAPLYRSPANAWLSLNVNGELAEYSDFGLLSSLSGGLTWRPSKRLRLSGSLSREEIAPSVEQLGIPITRVPNRRTFDLATGTTTEAIEVSGGNPDLRAEQRQVLNLNGRLTLLRQPNVQLTMDYTRSLSEDPIQRFPQQGIEVEQAFPERYLRDEQGTLIEFDTRPINLDELRRNEFRWGLRFWHQWAKKKDRRGENSQREKVSARDTAGSKSGAKQRSPSKRKTSERGARLRLALNHSVTLVDNLTFASGQETIDLIGTANAGRPRDGSQHQVTLRGSLSYRGFAARLNTSWREATVASSSRAGSLRYGSLLSGDLNLSYTFGRSAPWVDRMPFFEGTRFNFAVYNLFDTKPSVEDQFGLAPLGFTADELTPRGRHFELAIRKVFQ